ncbi:hypothetical protein ACFYV7_25245 [Nocardia suismassiliense]|uniref:Uncharacterized protein n=1 Tax=Nocardia suismassiliense TaxID=2077092 RepID=A0ABW6QY01_9NOCA
MAMDLCLSADRIDHGLVSGSLLRVADPGPDEIGEDWIAGRAVHQMPGKIGYSVVILLGSLQRTLCTVIITERASRQLR